MVVRNVPKLHALVGIVAATVALPTACSSDDFEGCAASRTCPSTNHAGEAGGGADTGGMSGRGGSSGEAGGRADTGGSAGSGAGGASGTGGSDDDGGHGGDGGSGTDTERPTVVSFTPADGDADVERDVTITAELSEPVDEATVTGESVTLSGPDGEVSGSVSVADNVISFVPNEPLTLLATYTFTLSDSIADLAGNTLAGSESAEFRARDGRWSEPTYPLGTTAPRTIRARQRNSRGDVVLGLRHSPAPEAVYAAVYDAARDQWTAAAELARAAGVQHFLAGAGIDANRRAIVAWDNPSTGTWSRFNGAAWTGGDPIGRGGSLIATPDGIAQAVWGQDLATALTQTMDLSTGAISPPVTVDITGRVFGPYPIASIERLGLVWSRTTADQLEQEIVFAWKDGSSWDMPQQLAQGPEIASPLFDSDEDGNIIVVWREADQIWSRIYERSRGAWTREIPVAVTTASAAVFDVDITSGSAIVGVNSFDATEESWVAVYRPGDGWVDASFASLDASSDGFPIEVNIDRAGNGLAVWQSELKFRRYIAGEGWQAASSLEANVDDAFTAGAPDGSVLVVSTDLERNPDGLPMAVRFE